ncbi:hypothetical protein RKD18_005802 [Streptomyces phaeoluteigriseus]
MRRENGHHPARAAGTGNRPARAAGTGNRPARVAGNGGVPARPAHASRNHPRLGGGTLAGAASAPSTARWTAVASLKSGTAGQPRSISSSLRATAAASSPGSGLPECPVT